MPQGNASNWWDKQYDQQRQHPFFRARQADRLKLAADLIGNAHQAALNSFRADSEAFMNSSARGIELDSFPVYVMLVGLAMENLAKGVLVAKNPQHFSDGKKPTHRLTKYIKECGLCLSAKQVALLPEVEACVVWAGRYPVPTSIGGWRLRRGATEQMQVPGTIDLQDKPEIEEIYDLLCRALRTAVHAAAK